ncbi:SDR family oxidoreductase [Paraburkholderia sp. SIMBA_049]
MLNVSEQRSSVVQFAFAYWAAKTGVIAFMKSVAKVLAHENGLINGVVHAIVETELFREMSDEHIVASKAKILMRRLLSFEVVCRIVSWVVSPACGFTARFTLDLMGGRAAY